MPSWVSELSSKNIHREEASYRVPGLHIRDHWFDVPLDHTGKDLGTITVYGREVVTAGSEEKILPWMLFLQGGPGFEATRPTGSSGWIRRALEGYRVLLLDQRGTGLSTPLTAVNLQQLGSGPDQAQYLTHFRADSIVRDAEIIRQTLLPPGETWTVLGQSFGGFCAVTYLSLAPQGLRQVLLTGGLPPVDQGCTAEAVYRDCYQRALVQTARFYARFPNDEALMREIVLHLDNLGGVKLPSGSVLLPRGMQFLGLSGLGMAGGFDRLHYLLERAWEAPLAPEQPRQLSVTFLHKYDRWLEFDTNVLYALLHEAIYCQGAASNWAAQRVRDDMDDKLDAVAAAKDGRPVPFTSEMIFPWMFDDWVALRPIKEAAMALASKEDWPRLYDTTVLNANNVPVAAAVYYDDLYVSRELSEKTIAEIRGIRPWFTNEYMHSGIREDGCRILDRLLGMLDGRVL